MPGRSRTLAGGGSPSARFHHELLFSSSCSRLSAMPSASLTRSFRRGVIDHGLFMSIDRLLKRVRTIRQLAGRCRALVASSRNAITGYTAVRDISAVCHSIQAM